jgi:N-methylhydantoinase A
MALRVGIDVGGTFTDIVVYDESRETLEFFKVPSSKPPEIGVLKGIEQIKSKLGLDFSDIARLIHGSTVATNALIEHEWVKTALVTTEGFRDVLEIGRQHRSSLYDFKVDRPEPIVPRKRRLEVRERIGADGKIIKELDESALPELLPQLADAEAVAICLLFSFLDPSHEQRVREFLLKHLDVPVICSSDVLSEYREYERTSTTVMNAGLRPVVGNYIDRLSNEVHKLGVKAPLEIIQSNGGLVSASLAAKHAESLLYSGPAGGVAGSQFIGEITGNENLITFDMGGTSCDVSLISEGRSLQRHETELAGYRVRVPMLDILSVGAGGGSIAWIDSGGALRVGPQSAGSDPGPVCFGTGDRPTVTDAQLVLGRFNPTNALGGRALDLHRAKDSIQRDIAEPLEMSIEEAALGILQIADSHMESAIRVITVERGHDPRDYALLAFGGGGPLHAVAVAESLGIGKVVVPTTAGVLSALGMLCADIRANRVRSILKLIEHVEASHVGELFNNLRADLENELGESHLSSIEFRPSLDLRYKGQAYEIPVSISSRDIFERDFNETSLINCEQIFNETHKNLYGYVLEQTPTEIVSLRLEASIKSQKPAMPIFQSNSSAPGELANREIYFEPGSARTCPVLSRDSLLLESTIEGPAIVEGTESTILILPEWKAKLDRYGTITIEKND